MRRLKDVKELKVERPQKAEVQAKKALKRMNDFNKRKEKFVTADRAGKN